MIEPYKPCEKHKIINCNICYDTAIPVCLECGCFGNQSCGHEPYNKKQLCSLDEVGFCGCCNFIAEATND